MTKAAHRFNCCKRARWKDGNCPFISMHLTCFSSTAKSLGTLQRKFQQQERESCLFVDLPSKQNGQWVQAITPFMMGKMHWVNPVFVCEIKFAEWTRDNKLRAPVFVGLREDKKASEVVREV